jgi:hypothetical protein
MSVSWDKFFERFLTLQQEQHAQECKDRLEEQKQTREVLKEIVAMNKMVIQAVQDNMNSCRTMIKEALLPPVSPPMIKHEDDTEEETEEETIVLRKRKRSLVATVSQIAEVLQKVPDGHTLPIWMAAEFENRRFVALCSTLKVVTKKKKLVNITKTIRSPRVVFKLFPQYSKTSFKDLPQTNLGDLYNSNDAKEWRSLAGPLKAHGSLSYISRVSKKWTVFSPDGQEFTLKTYLNKINA